MLDAGVEVLGVLTHDDQVDARERGPHAGQAADGPHVGVQVEGLPQRDVDAAVSDPADLSLERPLQRDAGAAGQPLQLDRRAGIEPAIEQQGSVPVEHAAIDVQAEAASGRKRDPFARHRGRQAKSHVVEGRHAQSTEIRSGHGVAEHDVRSGEDGRDFSGRGARVRERRRRVGALHAHRRQAHDRDRHGGEARARDRADDAGARRRGDA